MGECMVHVRRLGLHKLPPPQNKIPPFQQQLRFIGCKRLGALQQIAQVVFQINLPKLLQFFSAETAAARTSDAASF